MNPSHQIYFSGLSSLWKGRSKRPNAESWTALLHPPERGCQPHGNVAFFIPGEIPGMGWMEYPWGFGTCRFKQTKGSFCMLC